MSIYFNLFVCLCMIKRRSISIYNVSVEKARLHDILLLLQESNVIRMSISQNECKVRTYLTTTTTTAFHSSSSYTTIIVDWHQSLSTTYNNNLRKDKCIEKQRAFIYCMISNSNNKERSYTENEKHKMLVFGNKITTKNHKSVLFVLQQFDRVYIILSPFLVCLISL